MVKGLPIFKDEQINCDGCALGKKHRNEFEPIYRKGLFFN